MENPEGAHTGIVRLSNGTKIHPFLLKILQKRGLLKQREIIEFLEPKLSALPDPNLIQDMDKAVDLIVSALEKEMSIVIWGDYDVDGTTATALLLRFFTLTGHKDVRYHIPSRLQDGYGLNRKGLKTLAEENDRKKLLITVDNGISSHDEIDFAGELGFSCIVTDHHTPKDKKVSAVAVLNPKQNDCNFPDKNLAGVGVAFYLCIAVRKQLSQNGFYSSRGIQPPNLKQLLDLVALGTIADMVPLDGVNRILVKSGFEVLSSRNSLGITALCDETGIDCNHICSEDVSFQLAPKINAAGRIGSAEKAVELFLAKNNQEAKILAAELVDCNNRRKSINVSELQNAQRIIEKKNLSDRNALIIAGNFHIGVAGIISANITEEYGKPSVVLCLQEDGILKGSARSVPNVNLFECLLDCENLLIGFGGHPMAGGLSMEEKMLTAFSDAFEKAVHNQSKGLVHRSALQAEHDMCVHDLFSDNFLEQLHLLEPFGESNPQLIICDPDINFSQIKPVGVDKSHLRFRFGNGPSGINGVGFNLGKKLALCREKGKKKIYYTPTINSFRGKRNWEIRVLDVESSN